MKVLVSAYACEPGAGSEPGAGWEWSRAAAFDHDVWVLTRANNAPKIEEALAAEPELRMRPVYLDLPRWARFWKRGGWSVHLYYLLWQLLARRAARHLHKREHFDVAHHITLAVDWMPAGVVGISGLPAVWGPVGGATGMPWGLWHWLGWRGIVSEAVREATTRPLRRLFGDRVARQANLIVAQNQDVGRRFARHGPLVIEPNVALNVEALTQTVKRTSGLREGDRRHAVFVGRLIPWKGLRLAMATLAEPIVSAWELHVYGSGPEQKHAEKLANRWGMPERVFFYGQCDRSKVLQSIGTSDAFFVPSMHEAAGWAVGESVTLGVHTVCLDLGGPAIIAEEAGKAVTPAGRATPARLAEALTSTALRGSQTNRWSSARLPGLMKNWYNSVLVEELRKGVTWTRVE